MNKAAQNINALLYGILRNLKKFKKNSHPKYVHKLRIKIKKLRAIFSFLNETTFEQRFPEKICRKLFKKAGELRQWQLNLELFQSFLEHIIQIEDLKSKKIEKKFIRKISKYQKDIAQLILNIKKEEYLPKKKKIKSYFDRQIRKAKTELSRNHNHSNLHLFRKRIKKIMYVYDFLPIKMQKKFSLDTDYINHLQKQIGKWHDTVTTIKYFEKIDFPVDKYETLKIKEQSEYESLLKKCDDFIKEF
ncbi:MAG: CHAD domain-containing protein [Flavobacterium sp.]